MFVNLNTKIIAEKKASISINNRSFRYGDGCFETIKIINGKMMLAEYHFDRLFSSLQILQFDLPKYFTANFLNESILELVNKNNHKNVARVRLTFFRGNGGLYDAENNKPNYLIQSWPLNAENNTLNENGLIIGMYKNGFKAADNFANIKSNNFLIYAMAANHAKQQYWNDALILNHNETIADATIANVFIIKNKTIITPPLTDGPISGTMRRYLMKLLPTLGFSVLQQSIAEQDLMEADECFLTNAIQGIKWVRQCGNSHFQKKQVVTIYDELIKPLWQ